MTTQPYPRTADPSTPSPQLFHSPDGDDLASNISSRHSRANALGAGAANSSKQLVFPEPTTTKLLTKYFPLFPILITFKRANLRVVSTIGLVLFAMQHWAFVLNPHMKDHLGYQLGNVITYIMYGSQLSFYDPVIVASASVTAFLVVVYLLLAVTLVLVGCILFHLRPMDDHSEGKGITSDAARLLLNVMSTALLIPILQFCFASCVCGSSGYMWMLPNVENAVCWGSSHIAAFIPSLICLIVLIPLLYLKNTCVYDYAILSDTFQSRRHSVVEKMTFVRDVMSCLLFNVMLGWEVPLGFTILHAIFSAILVLSYMFFLPYYSMWMNRFYVCVHSVELVLSCGVVGQQITWGQGHKDSVLVLMVGGGCIVVLMCVICTDVRVRANFTFAMTRSCRCEYAVASREESELDTCSLHRDDEGERLLSDAGKVDDDAVNALPYPEGLMDSPKFCQYALLNQQVMESIAQQELNMLVRRGRASQHYKTLPVLEPCISRVYVDTDVALAASSIDLYAMQFEPEQLSDMMLVYGANIYSRALTTFADNAEVMLAFAAFITSYLPGLSFMGVDLVKRSLRGRTSVDQQFRCLRQANQLRVALGIRTHLYGVFSMKARAAHGRALQSIHKFWVKLAEPSVNIKEVAEVADSIGQRCEIAVGLFESALRNMQTPDYVLLGQIGDFFSEVMMASDSAQWCYDVRRDIYEARQARSMRGTRLHTATLEKVDELAKRTMELLRHEGRGGSQTWLSSSRILFHFVMAVTALFVVLVACCVGTLWVAVDMQRDLGELLVHSHLTGGVSIEVNKVMVLTSGAFRLDHSEFNPAAALSQLEAASRAITDQLKSISLMQRLEDSVRCVDVLFQSCIPYYWQPNPFSGPLSLWTMVHTFSEAARRAVANAENCKGQCSDYTFVLNSVGTISHALLIYSQEYGDRRLKDLSSTWRVSLASMLLTSIFSLVLVYLALHIALRRAVLNRIFTFQLCTLIPFDSLEMLASEARERYDNLRKGGKKWRARSRQLSTVVEQYPSLVLSPYVAATHQVTSCLKGAAAPAAAKPPHIDRHVHFSHVVSVIGSGDAHGVPADRVEDVDEEEGSVIAPRLLEHQLRQQKLAEQSMLTQRQRRRSLILSTFFVVALAACIVALIAIMYVLVTSQQSMYSTSLETFMGIESRAARVGFLMEKSLHAVLAFLRSGELIYYHNSHNYMSEMFYVIPHILGSIVPLNAAPKLLRMHEICQMVREMSIGASALAAKAHGVPLHYSMSGQLLDAMEEDELVELMAAKYSEAYQIAVSISDNILRGDLTLQFAYVIIGSQVPALSIEFRKLYSEVQRMIIETKFGDPANISICAWVGLALCCCAAFLCYAVLFTPRLQLIRVSIPRVNQVITAVAFSITVAAFVALVFVDVNIDRTFHDFHSSVEALNSFVSHTFSEIDLYVEFVLTLRSLPWFEAQTHASLESINGFVETISEDYLSAKNLFIVNELVDNGFTMMELNGIACALAIHAMHLENMPVEAPMLRRQMDTRWNAQMLPDKFHRRKVQYPESILFWNHTHDFSLSSKQQYVNAVGIVSSPEYLHLVDRVLSELQTLTIHFLEKEFNLHLASVGSRSPLLYVAIACLMLPIAATTVCIYHVLAALQRHLHLAEKADQMSYSHQRKFQHAMMRTAVFLVLLALGNALVYGVSMGLLYAAPIYVDEMLRPMETSNKIEELTQFTIISAMSNAGFFDEHAIETNIEFFTNVFNRQFITYKDGGVRRGLLPSTEYDIALFGSTDLDGTMPRMTSLIPIPCASLQHNSLVPSVPDDDTQFAHIVTVFSMMVTAIRTRLQIGRPVNSEELQLLKELQTATIKLEERQVTNIILFHALSVNQAKDATALIVLSALCLVATVSLFASIVIRLAKLMLAEEVSIRLLLHLIPTHVAHEVPAIAQYLETGAISNAAELQKRFDANEKLLQNILPEKIAARLKSGEQPIADTHDCVTMLFTDFVGFTKRSSTMQAREIVDFLNEVFLEFDTVVELLSLEKIKTIGDAFFMAAGLDAQMRDHALRVVEAGLMFFEALEEHNRRHPSRVPLQMRLGVHSGPVVAGVIGIKKVAYDLWGDSVEIANAMESTGVPGYVHISESTAELVRGFFKLEPRGELPREKEHIPDDMPNTYLVVGRLLPTPYMHLRRPKLGAADVSNSK